MLIEKNFYFFSITFINNYRKKIKLNLIEFFYFSLLKNCFFKFYKGFLLKPKKIFMYLNFFFLHYIILILCNCSFFKLDSLMDIFCVDYVSNRFISRFLISYSFWNINSGFRIFFRLFTNIFGSIFSLNTFFFNANWFEREIWDLFGLKFLFNFDLRRILTDYGFYGHPLRKNFPLIGFFEVRYDYVYKLVIYEPVELFQNFRYFIFGNPWKN